MDGSNDRPDGWFAWTDGDGWWTLYRLRAGACVEARYQAPAGWFADRAPGDRAVRVPLVGRVTA